MGKEKVYCKDLEKEINRKECYRAPGSPICRDCIEYQTTQRKHSSNKAVVRKNHNSKKIDDENYCLNADECSDKNCDTCDTTYVQGYIKHPPKGNFTLEELNNISLFVSNLETKPLGDEDGELPAGLLLQMRESSFKETKNPVYALEAFLIAHKAGLYPPMWLLDYINSIFEEYHKALGKKSLDRLFGLIPQKGQEPPFKSLLNKARDQFLCLDVFRLNFVFGIPIEKAANMVARRLEETPDWDKTGLKLKSISGDTIKRIYHEKWKDIIDNDIFRKQLLEWTDEKKEKYLKKFPAD